MNEQLLEGIRILDFGSFIAGPYAAMMLAEMGAEVIKIENKKRPDGSRFFVPAPNRPPADPYYGENCFDTANACKKSITVDISTSEGMELIKRLVAHCDIVIENFAPGVMSKNGLSYEDLKAVKPDIIYVSSSACGQTGPDKFFRGFAAHFACKAGLGYLTGYKDGAPSQFIGSIDGRSATFAVVGLLTALIYRENTGKGQYIDIASQEAIAAQLGDVYLDYILNGKIQMRDGNHRESYAPYNCYPCIGTDKFVSIAVATENEWQSLCEVMGKPELASDPRFNNYNNRYANQDTLDEIIGEWTKDKDYYEATEILEAAGVAAAPSLNAEGVIKNPHIVERNSFTYIDHPTLGKDCITSPPWRFSETPASITRHAPGIGEHTEEILKDILGISDKEIDELKENKII